MEDFVDFIQGILLPLLRTVFVMRNFQQSTLEHRT